MRVLRARRFIAGVLLLVLSLGLRTSALAAAAHATVAGPFERLVDAGQGVRVVVGASVTATAPSRHDASGYAPEIARVLARGRLIVAMQQNDDRPFAWTRPDGSLTGVDVLLAKALARGLGVRTVQIVRDAPTYDAVVDEVAGGRADFGISHLSETLPRARRVLFTRPYLEMRRALLVSRTALAEIGIAQDAVAPYLQKYSGTIAVERGSSYAHFALEDFPRAHIVQTAPWPAPLDAIVAGAASAVYRDEISIKQFLRDHPEARLRFRTAVFTDAPDAIAMCVAPNAPMLRSFADVFLTARRIDLTVDALLNADFEESAHEGHG